LLSKALITWYAILIPKCFTYIPVDYEHRDFCAIFTLIENLFSFVLGCVKIPQFDFSKHLQHKEKLPSSLCKINHKKHLVTPYRYEYVKIIGIRHHIRNTGCRCKSAISQLFVSLDTHHHTPEYTVFQKELYNFESLYRFIQRACTVF
jgi:hypothetical protein